MQNVENSNRENVYKLIDLWAKPEIHCDCAVLQPEVTCDCMLPDVRLSRREGGMEALVGYVSSNDRIRHENNVGVKQRMGHVTANCRGTSWDPDRGDTPREPSGLDEDAAAVVVFGSGRTLHRCTCSSGKCRHHQTTTSSDGSCRKDAAVAEVMEQEEEVDVERDPVAPHSPFPSPDSTTPAVGSPQPAFAGKRTTK